MMKKKLLIGLIAGGAVFAAAFGSAASLGSITGASVGAASSAVTACDTNGVTTAYTVAFQTGGYKVTEVTVGGVNDSACDGKTLSVQLADSGNAALAGASGTTTVASGTTSYVITIGTPPLASAAENVHVLIK